MHILALHLRVSQCAIVGMNDKEEQYRGQSGFITIQSCDCVQPDRIYCVMKKLDGLHNLWKASSEG